jgi:hypothetical protein
MHRNYRITVKKHISRTVVQVIQHSRIIKAGDPADGSCYGPSIIIRQQAFCTTFPCKNEPVTFRVKAPPPVLLVMIFI